MKAQLAAGADHPPQLGERLLTDQRGALSQRLDRAPLIRYCS
jgi:hypothetical protein